MGLMTAYGYMFEMFDALYSGDAHEIATHPRPFLRPICVELSGARSSSTSCRSRALWSRSVRRNPVLLFLIGTSVVVGMWLERYMILVTSLYRDFLPSSFGHYTASFWDWSTFSACSGCS